MNLAPLWRRVLSGTHLPRWARSGSRSRLAFTQDALESLEVLADGLESGGYVDVADRLRQAAVDAQRGYGPEANFQPLGERVGQAIARLRAQRPALETEQQRRARLARFYRRRGLPMKEAFALAKRAENIGRVVGYVGDRGWPAEEGGPILRTADGYSMEYVVRPDDSGGRYLIYGVDLEREGLPDWIHAADVARSAGISPTVLRKWWRDADPRKRAEARVMVASYHGWENLDAYPKEATRREVFLRYRRKL